MADEALERLLAGNRRFMSGYREYPDQSVTRRWTLAASQHPFAAILGCSDSRVPPEIIFDQGLGDIFTVRVAGNIVDNASLGSLEYAVQQLDVPLIVVLGHSGCGAVQAALTGGLLLGQIATLVAAIQPAVKQSAAGPGESSDIVLTKAVKRNIALVVRQLCTAAPILAPLVEKGSLKILGAYYDLASGLVVLLQ